MNLLDVLLLLLVLAYALSGYWQDPPQRETQLSTRVSSRMPIPACTVDDQIYTQCPSLLVATACTAPGF